MKRLLPLLLIALPACSPACFLKPTKAFDQATLAAAPDYTTPKAWAAHPDQKDLADLAPPGSPDAQDMAPADAFYVHPTIWFDREVWNDTLDSKKSLEMVDEVVLSGQAAAFNACCKVWAPRYRQTTIGAFYSDDPAQVQRSFAVAYSDIERAFDVFVARTGDRPIILAGHSQGSMHLMRLLERVSKDPKLRARLVAAYIPGFAHPMSRFKTHYPELAPCTEPTQTGCVASWDTYRDGADVAGDEPLVFWSGDKITAVPYDTARQCTNPITWRADDKASSKKEHLGAVLPVNTGNAVEFTSLLMSDDPVGVEIKALGKPRAAMLAARCDGRVLRVPDVSAMNYPVQETQAGNYHLLDYELFFADIRANAVARVAAWQAASPKPATPAP